MASVRANSAQIAGEVRGNIKIKESLVLSSSARVVGDIETTSIEIEAGALLQGKVSMPGLQVLDPKISSRTVRTSSKKSEAPILNLGE